MKVRIGAEQTIRFSQIVEMDEADYDRLCDLLDTNNDEDITEEVADFIDQRDISSWEPMEIDTFEKVEE